MSNVAQCLARAVESPFAQFLLDAAVKATVLLAAAMVATALMRRSSAAVRHRVWCLTFAALGLLPALSAALPEWRLAVLPYSRPLAPREESRSSLAQQADPAIALQPTPLASQSEADVVPLAEREDQGGPTRSIAAQGVPSVIAAAIAAESVPRPPDIASLWLTGMLIALLPLIVGFTRTVIVRRRSQALDDANWTILLDELRQRLSLARRVGLYETASALMPMTWGVLRPVVMLPREARDWTGRLRRIVLLHELAHIKRCDVGFQLLGRAACAVYWFHPLAWYALRRLRIERELACDDCVVLAGERATEYATELLQISRDYRTVPFAAAIAMAQRSNLEHRLRALFDGACSHLPVNVRTARILLATVLVLVTTTAVVRLTPRTKADDTQGDSGLVQLSGSVVDPSGRPVAGAKVDVRLMVTDASDPPVSSATTDATGRFRIGFTWPQSDERLATKPNLVVVADAEGLAADWKYLSDDDVPGEIALELHDEKTIRGRIVNSEGKPLAGVELRVQEIARYDRYTMRLLLGDVAQSQTVFRTYAEWRYGPLPRQSAHVTTTAGGHFQIAGLAADMVVKLRIRGAGIREAIFDATTAVRDTIRGPTPPAEPPYGVRAATVLYGAEFEYIAEPSRRIHGVVRDRETGRPVPGAKVSCSQETGAPRGALYQIEAETDTAGRYNLDGCGKTSRSTLSVVPPADEPAYLPAGLVIQDAPGLEPIVQDVELVKGIDLRGRIVDSETGEPLVASVQYAPLYLNMYAEPLYKQQVSLRCYTRSKADGSFRIVVAPGPGALSVSHPSIASREYITVRVSHDDVVRLFEASAKHRELAHSPELRLYGSSDSLRTQQDGGWGLLSQTGSARTVLISPDEDKPPEPLEVTLVRGRTIRGQVVDPDGQPLTGATAYLNNPGIPSQRLRGADFTLTALAADDKREIAFHHEQRKIGAFRTITADEPQPLVVRLEPCGAAVGRLVDQAGVPVEGRHVWFYRNGDLYSTELFSITDADGRFRIDDLIPGQPYEVLRSEPGSRSRLQFSREKRVFSVGSGQTHDLGDVVVKGAS